MGEVVNLRRVRKQALREAARVEAAASRAKHGQAKHETAAVRRERALGDALLDGARIERSGRDGAPDGQ